MTPAEKAAWIALCLAKRRRLRWARLTPEAKAQYKAQQARKRAWQRLSPAARAQHIARRAKERWNSLSPEAKIAVVEAMTERSLEIWASRTPAQRAAFAAARRAEMTPARKAAIAAGRRRHQRKRA